MANAGSGKSKAELRAEVRRLRRLLAKASALRQTADELDTYRKELQQQQAELSEARHALELSRDCYVDLFDFAPIGYALLDQYGTTQEINLMGAQLLGAERGRLVGYPFLLHVAHEERRAFLDFLTRCRHSVTPYEIELTLRSRAGRGVPAHMTCRRVRTSVDARTLLHAAIVDLTERRQAEAARERSLERERRAEAAAEAKDQFLAVLSHELRTPLAPVLLALHSLRERGVPAAFNPTFDMIQRNVEFEARLIDDLLDVTRIAHGKLQLDTAPVDARAAIEDVVRMAAEEVRAAGITLAVNLDDTPHWISGNATRLRQVMWNLVQNAVRHTPPGERIHVRSREIVPGTLAIEVCDTGTGIDPELLERVFVPFERGGVRGGGLGLGLAICKGIVEAHGGHIAARSDGPGTGATFTVELPTVAAPPARVTFPHPSARAAAGRRVLVVEDNRDNAVAMAELLRVHGYEVLVASTVEEALERARAGFDILLSDIGLPDGNGRDLMRRLCERGPVRAIALTGYGTERDVAQDLEAGFIRHLTKPVDPDQLLATIGELAQPAPAHAARRS